MDLKWVQLNTCPTSPVAMDTLKVKITILKVFFINFKTRCLCYFCCLCVLELFSFFFSFILPNLILNVGDGPQLGNSYQGPRPIPKNEPGETQRNPWMVIPPQGPNASLMARPLCKLSPI